MCKGSCGATPGRVEWPTDGQRACKLSQQSSHVSELSLLWERRCKLQADPASRDGAEWGGTTAVVPESLEADLVVHHKVWRSHTQLVRARTSSLTDLLGSGDTSLQRGLWSIRGTRCDEQRGRNRARHPRRTEKL